LSNKEQRRLGSEGEDVVRQWLKKQGYVILPSSLIETGKAPMLEGEVSRTILPNNLTWLQKRAGWIEVKTKSHPTKHENPPRRYEHGLPLRHWNAYLNIQEETAIPVSLAILEIESGLLLMQYVDKLAMNKRGFYMDGEPHIYLSRDDFDMIPINLNLPDPIQPLAERTLKQCPAPTYKQERLL